MGNNQAIKVAEFQEFDPRRHVAKLLHDSDKSRVVLFCLEAGQELPAHESTSEVVFYGVDGNPTILLGNERVVLSTQSVVVCPPLVAHGISAGAVRATVLAVIAPRPG
ncbi:MAG: hypothetical protein Q7T05_05390 [Dehalococcoidia bacterium]|nr:hypothetical protein [Dehalococcoidia bacterium]